MIFKPSSAFFWTFSILNEGKNVIETAQFKGQTQNWSLVCLDTEIFFLSRLNVSARVSSNVRESNPHGPENFECLCLKIMTPTVRVRFNSHICFLVWKFVINLTTLPEEHCEF